MNTQLRRHDRLPQLTVRDTSKKLFFTKDKKLLRAYYEVRKNCYRSVADGPQDFSNQEDSYDKVADILVIVINGRVVGGARLVGSTPDVRLKLPVEQEKFMMKNVFPHLKLEKESYCEFGRIAILSQYRGAKLLEELCGKLIKKAIAKGYRYQFSMAPIIQTRCYRRVSKALELPYPYIIHKDIQVPRKPSEETGDLKMYLGSLKLPTSLKASAGFSEAIHKNAA